MSDRRLAGPDTGLRQLADACERDCTAIEKAI